MTVSQVLSQFWRTSSFFRFYSFMQGEAVIVSALSTSGKMLSLICWDLHGIFSYDFDEQLFKKFLLLIPFGVV